MAEQDFSLNLEDLRPRPREKKHLSEYFMPRRHSFIIFHPDRCTGCGACEMICSTRNTEKVAPVSASVKVVRDEKEGKNFSILCQHCRKPLCLPACPTRAIEKGDDGIVRIDKLFCTECGLCTMACPAAAPHKRPRQPGNTQVRPLRRRPSLREALPRECPHLHAREGCPLDKGSCAGLPSSCRFSFWSWSLSVRSATSGREASASPAPRAPFRISHRRGLLCSSVFHRPWRCIILTVLAGRLFCGWVCPFGFVLDVVDKITPKKIGWPSFLKSRMTKYGVLAGAVGGSYALGFQVFCTVCPIGTLCRSYGVQSFFRSAELAIVPVLASLEIAERRSWCRYFCPVGAVLGLTALLRMIKIVIGAKRCKKFSCIQCAEVCPVGIIDADKLREGVSPKIPMTECIMCMRCIDRCPYECGEDPLSLAEGDTGRRQDMNLSPAILQYEDRRRRSFRLKG